MHEVTTEVRAAHRTRARLAESYAARGWYLTPTGGDTGKRPVVRDWEGEATADPYEAWAAWSEKGDWAGHNMAICCGPSRLVVLDIDLKDGRDGFESLRQLGIHLPETYTVRTPTGGLHMYYKAPPGIEIRNSANVLGSGIDVRAAGGIVIAAGSENAKGRYEVNADLPVAALPTALAMRLATKQVAKRAEQMPDMIPQGERETVLVSVAGSMRRRGLSVGGILAALRHENETRCEPPLDDEDLERIANSMGRYEPVDVPADTAPEPPVDPDDVEIDLDLYKKQLVTLVTTQAAADAMRERNMRRQREVLGGLAEPVNVLDFLAAGPDPVATCIWGHAVPGGTMGWAANQGVIIAGPPGTGKSTIALQVVLRRVGILAGEVLGMPVVPDLDSPLTYLALDRADQIRQSMRRMLPSDLTRDDAERLRMIDNLPPNVSLRSPETFISWLQAMGSKAVVMDSAKDLGFDLNDSGEGQAFNFLVQATLRAGIQVLVTHHSRKVPRGDRKPLTLNDLHGSQWVAAGAGSVIMLDGEAGPKAKRLVHVKPLTVPMAPLLLELNPETGEVDYRDDDGSMDEDEEKPSRHNLRDRVCAFLREGIPANGAEIARQVGANSGSVSKVLRQLFDQGIVERTGDAKWQLWMGEDDEEMGA